MRRDLSISFTLRWFETGTQAALVAPTWRTTNGLGDAAENGQGH